MSLIVLMISADRAFDSVSGLNGCVTRFSTETIKMGALPSTTSMSGSDWLSVSVKTPVIRMRLQGVN